MRICTRCVMDDQGDDSILFTEEGFCNYCTEAIRRRDLVYFPNETGSKHLSELLVSLKEEGKGHDYDCLMGISGGLDSAYLLYLAAMKWQLRVLALHVDDGFNTDVSDRNIERLGLLPGVTLKRINVDQQQYNNLVKSLILAGVPNLAMAQDNTLFTILYQDARRYRLRSFLSGSNFALESILQKGNSIDAFDLRNLRFIHKKFGSGSSINKLRLMTPFMRDMNYIGIGIKTFKPLNLIDYNRDRAMEELKNGCGFEYYGSKHLENTLTKFLQLYWLPKKFGVDKRKAHFSSMIVSGQMSRQEALEALTHPAEGATTIERDIEHLLREIKLSHERFAQVMAEAPHQHTDYPTSRYIKIAGFARDLRWRFLTSTKREGA